MDEETKILLKFLLFLATIGITVTLVMCLETLWIFRPWFEEFLGWLSEGLPPWG